MALAVERAAPSLDVRHLKVLPPLPLAAPRILAEFGREDARLAEVVQVIALDPPLAARILGLANSAFFAAGPPVLTLEEAIGRVLGLDLVRGLAVAITLGGAFDPARCAAFALDRYWLRAVLAGGLAVQLAAHVPQGVPVAPRVLHLAGLLHGIGELCLAHLEPHAWGDLLRRHGEGEITDLEAATRALLGHDSTEVGACLARRWALPAPIATVIARHRTPVLAQPDCVLVRLVALAATAARQWSAGRVPELPPEDLQVVGLRPPHLAAVLAAFAPRLEALRALAAQMAA